MSGGGRCNFTNTDLEFDNFLSKNKHFCKSALSRYTAWDFIDLVKKHQIEFEERKHNQLFCIHSAKDIVKMLLKECELNNVEIIINTEITSVSNLETEITDYDKFRVEGHEHRSVENSFKIDCKSLIVATGALSVPTLGGSDFGYRLAEQFHMPIAMLSAGLVPFMYSDSLKPFCEKLSGISTDAEVSCNNKSFICYNIEFYSFCLELIDCFQVIFAKVCQTPFPFGLGSFQRFVRKKLCLHIHLVQVYKTSSFGLQIVVKAFVFLLNWYLALIL